LWKEDDIGLSSWQCNLHNHPRGSTHNSALEYVCHAFVSWFTGAHCGGKKKNPFAPFSATEKLLRSKGLDSWVEYVSAESSCLQKIMVGSYRPKGKEDNMCLRANDKEIIYLLTHVILPATGYSISHTNRLGGFTRVFLKDIHTLLVAVFSSMNLNNARAVCDHQCLLYKSRDATWAKEEEVFLEVMISLIFLYQFDPSLYYVTNEFSKTVDALRHTYECSSNTIVTEASIKYHWDAADQDLHTCVLRYMFLEACTFFPETKKRRVCG
jgi:hypothetical protein